MTNFLAADALFWKRKLAAFLHDPPSKCLDIARHGEQSEQALRNAGFTDDEIADFRQKEHPDSYKHPDHTAAAADRLPFPHYAAGGLRCFFDGEMNQFRHPLAGAHTLKFDRAFRSAEEAISVEQAVQPLVHCPAEWNDTEQWRARFFAHWRLWPARATASDYRFGFLPADTRIPDHNIWAHMGVVSALAGCSGHPAFLKLQLGPVQDFIAAARNTRDLWSGSFLLSWLMATGLHHLANTVGPDSVIFPNLRGQPLLDLRWRDELWQKLRLGENQEPVWASESFPRTASEFLVPNLPNVFLALVPAEHAETIARDVERVIRAEWKRIAADVLMFARDVIPADRIPRYGSQCDHFLQVAWQVTPWPATTGEALGLARQLPDPKAVARVQSVLDAFERHMPEAHRDPRYYTDGTRSQLNNLGLGWSLLVALNAWQLDAARQTHGFNAWSTGGWEGRSTHNSKDALTGREEMVVGGSGWSAAMKKRGQPWSTLFKHDDPVGAISLIKRTWHLAHLANKELGWGYHAEDFGMPDTRSIAIGEIDKNTVDERDIDDANDDSSDSPSYFAVLAFDGDSIGQWVSGGCAPAIRAQLANYSTSGSSAEGALAYFERASDPDNRGRTLAQRFAQLLDTPRPLSPAYHLQFSEALSNFALLCAGRIVEAHKGRLLYAGGDDVLAVLPASSALACADDLQRAFCGEAPNLDCDLRQLAPGFLALATEILHDNAKRPIPFIVPGPAATASVGIAIAHFKAPLQDVVGEARSAEKRAKKLNGKHAVAVSALKRSGEITQWVGRFDETASTSINDPAHRGGLAVLEWLQHGMDEEILSGKFPHRLIELLEPYISAASQQNDPHFDAFAVFSRELDHCLSRQRGSRWATSAERRSEITERLRTAFTTYASNLPGQASERLKHIVKLCTIAAFLYRQPTA